MLLHQKYRRLIKSVTNKDSFQNFKMSFSEIDYKPKRQLNNIEILSK
jgi:hypothetical protein